jgi:hypothetical protein
VRLMCGVCLCEWRVRLRGRVSTSGAVAKGNSVCEGRTLSKPEKPREAIGRRTDLSHSPTSWHTLGIAPGHALASTVSPIEIPARRPTPRTHFSGGKRGPCWHCWHCSRYPGPAE